MAKTKQKSKKQKDSAKKSTLPKTSKKGKKKYKVKNWSEYNKALVNRGRLQVWVDESVLESWYAGPSGRRGAQPTYSDLAIKLTLQLGKVFKQRLRQTEGLVQSVFGLMNITVKVPNYSTLSRRGDNLKVTLPEKKKQDEKTTIIIDSSGLKVFGEGEWKVRKHGYSKHRTWRKIHLSISPDGEIRKAELTENSITDDTVSSRIIKQEKSPIEAFLGDGAHDRRKVYDACQEKQVSRVMVPPRKDAKIWQHGNSKAPPHVRDENLRAIRKTSLKRWKVATGYHVRSLAEVAVYRYKTIFNDRLEARNMPQQKTETLIKCSILNKMLSIGRPATVVVG